MGRRRKVATEFLDALPVEGERRLMLAVLIDAIRALGVDQPASNDARVHRAWLRDRAWFRAEDRSAPFSFVNICDNLGLDAGYVRRCVLSPPPSRGPLRIRRYAEKAEESWLRQRRDDTSDVREIARSA